MSSMEYGRHDIERVLVNPANVSDHMLLQAEYIMLGEGNDNNITGGDAWPITIQKHSCARLGIWFHHLPTKGGNTT